MTSRLHRAQPQWALGPCDRDRSRNVVKTGPGDGLKATTPGPLNRTG